MAPDPASPRLFLITGIMAAGKSTVAQALAERFGRSVHVRGDAFRRMIVSGRVEMSAQPTPAALDQLRLRYELTAATAHTYLRAGFTTVVQDVVIGPMLSDVVALYDSTVDVVVLCPDAATVTKREAGRAKTGYTGFSPSAMDYVLRNDTPRLGRWLDNSDLSVDETVDAILS